jgi:lantibiotic transport system permease protein
MASFVINTRVELWKCRKSAAYWITIIGSAFIPLVVLVMYVARPDVFVKELGANPWKEHIVMVMQPTAAFLLPMYTILVTSLVVQIEYRNNTWKQVYASPRSFADIYFSKYLVVHLLIISCFLLFNMFLVLSGYIANIFRPGYSFFSAAVPWENLFLISGRLYVSILALTAIQYWISLRLRNYIAPVGIGLALLITGIMAMKWDKIIYYPYAYTAVTFFKDGASKAMGKQGMFSVIWMAAILVLSFWDTINRREKG